MKELKTGHYVAKTTDWGTRIGSYKQSIIWRSGRALHKTITSLESKQGALYQLDRSQFERLSLGALGRPKIPVAELEVQRCMRPDIFLLIRETIYPRNQDFPTVNDLPDVVGMRDNLFWLDNDQSEDGEHSEMLHMSRSNIWEARMVHALVRHIVRQGAYSSSEFVTLGPNGKTSLANQVNALASILLGSTSSYWSYI